MSEIDDEAEPNGEATGEERRLHLGSRIYLLLYRVFIAIGVVAFGLFAAEWIAASGLLPSPQSQMLEASVEVARSLLGYIWPALMVAMPATYLLMSHKSFGFMWPAWALVWIPFCFVYGHSMLVERLFDSGILGLDHAPLHRWDILLLNLDYLPYAVNVGLKGAAFDLLESFKISISEPAPSSNVWIFRSIEFAFRTLYSAWGAIVIFRLYQFLTRGRGDV